MAYQDVQGAPFGVLAGGFLSLGSWQWVEKWLQHLDGLLEKSRDYKVDFILPAM